MTRTKRIALLLVLSLLVISFISNPSNQEYQEFSEETTGIKIPEDIELERINFYLFSTYSVQAWPYEHGIVHLGFMGKFFQISNGQYDYPSWLEFFN